MSHCTKEKWNTWRKVLYKAICPVRRRTGILFQVCFPVSITFLTFSHRTLWLKAFTPANTRYDQVPTLPLAVAGPGSSGVQNTGKRQEKKAPVRSAMATDTVTGLLTILRTLCHTFKHQCPGAKGPSLLHCGQERRVWSPLQVQEFPGRISRNGLVYFLWLSLRTVHWIICKKIQVYFVYSSGDQAGQEHIAGSACYSVKVFFCILTWKRGSHRVRQSRCQLQFPLLL